MTVRLSELVAVLTDHHTLLCCPTVAHEGAHLILTVEISGGGLAELSLRHELEYLADVATLRALCSKYDIPAARLEALLPKEGV
jgi:hypothetical protein